MAGLEREGMLFALVGPVGSGKTTLGNRLRSEFGATVNISISITTRAMRPGEQDGVAYRFVSRSEFQKKINENAFFEWEEIHGNLYGTPKSNVENAIKGGYDLLLDIDIRGAASFRRAYPGHTVVVFLIPPSFTELKKRILGRSPISDAELATRLATAEKEYSALRHAARSKDAVDYVIVNDQLDETYRVVSGVLMGERSRLSRIREESLSAMTILQERNS